jgi:hypothetical protein
MNMRYSRLKKRRRKKRYAKLFLTALLILGILYVVSAGKLGKFVSRLVSPIINQKDNSGGTDEVSKAEPILTVPEDKADSKDGKKKDTSKVTETIKANSLSMFTIQMSAFTDEKNANEFAKQLQSEGGAGYVLKDEFFRVLAVGFQKEEDAKKVKEQLKADGMESHIYPVSSSGADMKITATKTNISAIRSAYEMWEEKYLALEKVIRDLDSDAIPAADAYGQMEKIKKEVTEKEDELKAMNARQDNNAVLSGLVSLYESGSKSFDGILAEKSSDKVTVSSKIKYTHIEMIMRYKEYMTQIAK